MKPNWKSKQLIYWNQRAATGQGTGKVPYRKMELFFAAYWVWGTRILDAGCGLGEVMRFVQSYNKNATLTGIDLSDEFITQGRKSGLNVFQSDILNINASDNQFDTSIAVRVVKNILDLEEQRVAIRELARVSSKRIIVIDSIKESMVTSPDYNLYLSRHWLVESFLQEGFNLLWEEYFQVPFIKYPIIASSQSPVLGSDEGFFVFDRVGGKRFGLMSWKSFEIKLSISSLLNDIVKKIIHLFR